MDEMLKPLIQYGTDHLEEEERADALQLEYLQKLRIAWPKRGRGLSHDAVEAAMVIIFCPLFLGASFFLYSCITTSEIIPPQFACFAYWGALAFIVCFIYLLIQIAYSFANINKHTNFATFRKYPIIRRASLELADPQKKETLRDYLPILHIDEKKYFLLVFRERKDKLQSPTGVLLLNERGKIVKNESLMEKAYLTAFLGIVCGHIIQKNAVAMRREMNHVIAKRIPDAVKRIERSRKVFSEHGIMKKADAILDGVESLQSSLREALTIIDGENAFRKAMGYGFALEFYYKDAVVLRELYLAYVRYLNAAFRKKIIGLTTACAQSISILQNGPGWKGRPQLLQALAVIAVAGPNGVLSWIWQREYEGIVTEKIRKRYNEKTIWAKNSGWPMAEEEL